MSETYHRHASHMPFWVKLHNLASAALTETMLLNESV